MNDLLRVGCIASTHGIRGEVKIYATTDDVSRFKKMKKCILDTGKEQLHLEVEGVKFFKEVPILKFKGIDNINDIEKYKGKDILVTREEAVPLKKDEYFVVDLIGLKVITDDGEAFGTLKDVLFTGANDVYIIETEKYGEVLIPATMECVPDINMEQKQITVHLMDGLLDL